MTVYILTWCGFEDRLHGSTLIFKTIRHGFPTANIVVVDNASIDSARPNIRELCAGVGATFYQIDESIQHHAFIANVLAQHPASDGPAIICDPDICFWDSMEDQAFDGLVAGRLLPQFFDPYSQCLTYQRLHSSFLWIQDAGALRVTISELSSFFEFDPFRPVMAKFAGQWLRYDTCAALFHALPGRMQPFTETEMDRYDHLFCGSHLHLVLPSFTPEIRDLMVMADEVSKSDHTKLRGIWRLQDKFFQELSKAQGV